MTYSIVQPPFDLKFRERPKQELLAYKEWFHAVMPERELELRAAVKATDGFENWAADRTPDSLAPLGEWFGHEVRARKRSDDETAEIRSRLTFPMEVPEQELTNRTFSLAIDIGMYFGSVIVEHVPGTRWDSHSRGAGDSSTTVSR